MDGIIQASLVEGKALIPSGLSSSERAESNTRLPNIANWVHESRKLAITLSPGLRFLFHIQWQDHRSHNRLEITKVIPREQMIVKILFKRFVVKVSELNSKGQGEHFNGKILWPLVLWRHMQLIPQRTTILPLPLATDQTNSTPSKSLVASSETSSLYVHVCYLASYNKFLVYPAQKLQ